MPISAEAFTTVADAVLEKVVGFAIEKAGPPPCDFAFIIMGSEGRNEQTLKTDQDNAIIYEDLEDDEQREEAGRYFLDLAADIDLANATITREATVPKAPSRPPSKSQLFAQPLPAAPSFTPEALPAVTVPPSRNGARSFPSASSVVSRRSRLSSLTHVE